MKKNLTMLASLLLLMTVTGSLFASAQPAKTTKASPDAYEQKSVPAITKIVLVLILLGAGFQMAIGQDDLSIAAQSLLEQISKIKKSAESGTEYAESSSEGQWIKRAKIKEERDRFYSKFEPTPAEKKKFDESLDSLAASLNKKGGGIKKAEPTIGETFALEEIKNVEASVRSFDPAEQLILVTPAEGEWLLRAVSLRARATWAKSFFKDSDSGKDKFNESLDALAKTAAKKIPAFKPIAENFAFRSAADEALITKALGKPENNKIHKIGLADKAWQIVKNELDVPTSRYKQGYAWVRNSGDDHSYCHLYQVNIIQEYTGGGKYGPSKAKLLNDALIGCP